MEMINKSSKGFTLVELSIVLVIVGLLIGGILVGQSLINNAKINSFINFVSQTDIAVSQFKNKYKGLPGDARAFGGDGDGVLETAVMNSGGAADMLLTYETANFWRHLSQDGFMPDKVIYDNDVSTGIKAGSDVPEDKYADKKGSGIAINMVSTWGENARYYYFCDLSATVNASYSTGAPVYSRPSYKPITVQAIDQKLDDGIIRAADMVSYKGIVSTFTGVSYGMDCYDTTTLKPKVNMDTPQCCIRVKILGISG